MALFSKQLLRSQEDEVAIEADPPPAQVFRAAGIPARWQSGWESKPSGWNMHDWTEIYVAPWGWLPCDPSYGVQKSDDAKIADFYIGHQDSYRMIVNLDYGRALCPPKQSLRSEPADFQRGEVEIDGKNLYFGDWDYEMKFWVDGKRIYEAKNLGMRIVSDPTADGQRINRREALRQQSLPAQALLQSVKTDFVKEC